MIFLSLFLALIVTFLDVFFWTGISAAGRVSFFLVALTLAFLARAQSTAKQLALTSGFLFDLIFPATFGFFLFWHWLIYFIVKKLSQSFSGSRRGVMLFPLVFISAAVYYLGLALVMDRSFSLPAVWPLLLSAFLTGLVVYALRSVFDQRSWRRY